VRPPVDNPENITDSLCRPPSTPFLTLKYFPLSTEAIDRSPLFDRCGGAFFVIVVTTFVQRERRTSKV